MRRTSHLFPALGPRIRDRRTAAGVTQQDLAAAAGCSTAFLSLVEQGRARPSVTRLDRIAAHLGVDHDELRRLAGYETDGSARYERTIQNAVRNSLRSFRARRRRSPAWRPEREPVAGG